MTLTTFRHLLDTYRVGSELEDKVLIPRNPRCKNMTNNDDISSSSRRQLRFAAECRVGSELEDKVMIPRESEI